MSSSVPAPPLVSANAPEIRAGMARPAARAAVGRVDRRGLAASSSLPLIVPVAIVEPIVLVATPVMVLFVWRMFVPVVTVPPRTSRVLTVCVVRRAADVQRAGAVDDRRPGRVEAG